MVRFRDSVKNYLLPSFNELNVFLLSSVLFTLFCLDSNLRSVVFSESEVKEIPAEEAIGALFVFILIVVLLDSTWHVFVSGTKRDWEKGLLMFFAIMTNGIIGVLASIHIIQNSNGWFLVFPIWNLITSITIVYISLWYETMEIDKSDTTIPQLIIGFTVTFAIFVVCHFVYDFHWAVTFSICSVYSTSINEGFQVILRIDKSHEQT